MAASSALASCASAAALAACWAGVCGCGVGVGAPDADAEALAGELGVIGVPSTKKERQVPAYTLYSTHTQQPQQWAIHCAAPVANGWATCNPVANQVWNTRTQHQQTNRHTAVRTSVGGSGGGASASGGFLLFLELLELLCLRHLVGNQRSLYPFRGNAET